MTNQLGDLRIRQLELIRRRLVAAGFQSHLKKVWTKKTANPNEPVTVHLTDKQWEFTEYCDNGDLGQGSYDEEGEYTGEGISRLLELIK